MTKFKLAATVPALALVLSAGAANALKYDQDVTPDVIFGSGNANGGFTVDRGIGIELGLRGKLRFNDSNSPENTYNSDGAGTYTFRTGTPDLTLAPQPSGFPGWASNTTPIWNFEWSVNSEYNDSIGNKLDDFDYVLELDTDPGPGTTFTNSFDPINVMQADHAIGDNLTGNGGGSVAADAIEYAALIANNNVAQNSWNYEFFNDATGPLNQTSGFNPNVKGDYLIRLSAVEKNGGSVASTEITINVVPVPAALPLLLTVFGGLGLAARYRRKVA